MQQQGTPQSLFSSSWVHHQVLDVGAGPALANANDAFGIPGDQTECRVIFRVGLQLLLPHLQSRYATAAFEVTELHQPVHSGAKFGTVLAQLEARWPIG
ncbi:hypothetical protein D3C76_1534760 [compost metagenome]